MYLHMYPPHTQLQAAYGAGTGAIAMTRVACSGSESELGLCAYSNATSRCTHSRDVGVACTGKWAWLAQVGGRGFFRQMTTV